MWHREPVQLSGQCCVKLAKSMWLCLSVGCKLGPWVNNQSQDLLCDFRELQKNNNNKNGQWLRWQKSNGTFVLSTEKSNRHFANLIGLWPMSEVDVHPCQSDYIVVRKRFQSGVNSARTQFSWSRHWKWPWLADDDFHLRLKRISKPNHTRLKFDLEKLKDLNVFEIFQAMIGGKFALLTIMNNEDTDMDSVIFTFNTAVTETASEILGKHLQKKKTLGHCRNSWSVR